MSLLPLTKEVFFPEFLRGNRDVLLQVSCKEKSTVYSLFPSLLKREKIKKFLVRNICHIKTLNIVHLYFIYCYRLSYPPFILQDVVQKI